jgi:hypothetical protein
VQYGFSISGNPNDDVFPVLVDGEASATATSTFDTSDVPQASTRDSEGSLPVGLLGAAVAEAEAEGSKTEAETETMSSILQAADRIRARNGASDDVTSESSNDDASAMRLHSVSRSLLRRLAQRSLSGQQSESSPIDIAVKGSAVEESSRSVLLSLLEEVQTLSANYPTSLDEDNTLLYRISSDEGPLVAISPVSESAIESSAVSAVNSDGTRIAEKSGVVMLNKHQFEACIRQRIERKQLILCTQNVLKEALSVLNA